MQSRKGNLPDLHTHTRLQTVRVCASVFNLFICLHNSQAHVLKVFVACFLCFFVALLRQFVVAAAVAAVFCALLFNDTCAHIWQLIRIHLPHLCMTVRVLALYLKLSRSEQNVISCLAHPQHFCIKSVSLAVCVMSPTLPCKASSSGFHKSHNAHCTYPTSCSPCLCTVYPNQK